MNDDVGRELVAAVNGLTAALQERWAVQDDRARQTQRAAEAEELNLLRPMLAATQQVADRLRSERQAARAQAEALAAQLEASADLTDIPTERTI